jgi:crotonobetainyl-CoA:carnitine CoA-transferase CaiB-like acyl-CoA transferase
VTVEGVTMASGPLDGIKLLEFTQIIAGRWAARLLSDLGAEVIKVEPPEGEPWRLNVQFIPLESKTFIGLNRGKKSLAIDVGTPEAQEASQPGGRRWTWSSSTTGPDVARG